MRKSRSLLAASVIALSVGYISSAKAEPVQLRCKLANPYLQQAPVTVFLTIDLAERSMVVKFESDGAGTILKDGQIGSDEKGQFVIHIVVDDHYVRPTFQYKNGNQQAGFIFNRDTGRLRFVEKPAEDDGYNDWDCSVFPKVL